jgi:hypothetical protein
MNLSSDTSKAAAASLSAETLSRLRFEVRRFIQAAGPRGATCDEVEVGTGLSHQTASARCTELMRADLIRDSGARRRTRSGRTARVYQVSFR